MARISVVESFRPEQVPSQPVQIQPERQTVPQGSRTQLTCVMDRQADVVWSKVGDDNLASNPNVQINGATLTILNVQVPDRGVYVCTVGGGIARASSILEIERREAPKLEIYPGDSQTATNGQSILFQCRVVAGIPNPEVTWTRVDGRPFPENVEVLNGGVIR